MATRKTKPASLQVSLTIDPQLLALIDDAAHALGLSRASFLRMAAIKQLPIQQPPININEEADRIERDLSSFALAFMSRGLETH